MNPILVIREEIVCLIILLFIMLYSRLYKMGKDHGNFMRICIFAIGHVSFDLITVLTVNNVKAVPGWLNWVCHIIFYMFALLFSYEFFCYTVARCFSKDTLYKTRILGLIPLGIYLIAVSFLPITFLSGNGTNYSFGTAAVIGYGVAMLFFVISIVIVISHLKVLDSHIVSALLPMLATAVIAESVQIAIPELLFTGGAVTIITVGFFFSLENPVIVLRQKVLFDAMTGVESRNSYEADIIDMEKSYAAGQKFGMVFCDINDLKAVNDSFGHLEGDAYIGNVAQTLMRCMKSADKIYRMGGDEFLCVYIGKNIDRIKDETAQVVASCSEQSMSSDYQISVSVGYALSGNQDKTLRDVLRTADYQMYTSKAAFKKNRAYLLSDGDKLNISGLTDRIFDAFAGSDSNRFLFVSNMTTNVTRWSRSAEEYFGLKSEFIYDCSNVWREMIHPDDRDTYFDDISAVFSGNQKFHNVQYRIMNANHEYVMVSCNGTILRGKNGDPDLFAGTLIVLGIEDTIDRITDLRNRYEMVNHFNYLIRTHTPSAMLKLSILNLNRINMLYGYICGNDLLKQFAEVLRNVVGKDGNIFHVDGTKFVISIPYMDKKSLTDIFHNIKIGAEQHIHLDTLTPPLQIAGGAYMLKEDFNGTCSLLRGNLIFAYSRSKYEQRGRLIFYDTVSDSSVHNAQKNHILLSVHQDAIGDCSGFYLVYQPIVNAKSHKIIGAEALIRWSNKEFGAVSPADFVPWLEEDPCFYRLGNKILLRALTDAKKMLDTMPNFTVNVNIAMQQLEHDGFRESVMDALEKTGFPASGLCLELTERCRELDENFLKGEIDFFRSHGIRIALDDLGTGFSSFSLLLSQNIDEVKIDHHFVGEIQTKNLNRILTKLIIDAAGSIGCSICLEGVETTELKDYLKDYGASYYQGYYCAKPLLFEDFEKHTKKWNSFAE